MAKLAKNIKVMQLWVKKGTNLQWNSLHLGCLLYKIFKTFPQTSLSNRKPPKSGAVLEKLGDADENSQRCLTNSKQMPLSSGRSTTVFSSVFAPRNTCRAIFGDCFQTWNRSCLIVTSRGELLIRSPTIADSFSIFLFVGIVQVFSSSTVDFGYLLFLGLIGILGLDLKYKEN